MDLNNLHLKYKKRKQIRIIFAAVSLVLVVFVVIALVGGDGNNKPASKTDKNEVNKKIYLSKDSDGDGLKDWEEPLYSTNPQLSDTDNDGTPDGEEINQGRDPTIPAPGDKFVKPKENIIAGGLNQNLSARLSQTLIDTYIEKKTKNPNIDLKSIAQAASDRFMSSNPESIVNARTFNPDQLNISQDNSQENINTYLENLVSVFEKKLPSFGEPLMFLASTLQKPKQSRQFYRIADFANKYNSAIKGMLEMQVPSKFSSAHIKLLNSFSVLKSSLDILGGGDNDPLGILIAAQTYYRQIQDIQWAFSELNNIIGQNNIQIKNDPLNRIILKFYQMPSSY